MKPEKTKNSVWSVVREVGIEYPHRSESADAERLQHPIYATKEEDGTYLIVDDLCAEMAVPFRLGCRTVRVDERGEIMFDTLQLGIDDGYGCSAGNSATAVLRRTKWQLLLFSASGNLDQWFDLTTFSKRMPRIVTPTERGTFLVVFLDRARQLDIVEIDRRGRLVWHLPPDVGCLGVPGSVQLLPTDTILVADSFRHAAVELDRRGNIVWQFGEFGDPSLSYERLAGPASVRATTDGRRLIADTRNHRVVSLDVDGTGSEIELGEGALSDPAYVDATGEGHLLVCDSGNARVFEVDDRRQVVWQYGVSLRSRRWFSFPRSVEVTGPGEYLIADTAHDRILTAIGGRVQELPSCEEASLFWPRCVRRLPSGCFLIADGRRGRILEVSPRGQILNQLAVVNHGRPRPFEDPHDVRLLPNGHLLVTDSPQDAVFEVDWTGHVHRIFGGNGSLDLDDPHSAQQLEDGTVVICDTGHHRVVMVDTQGECINCIDTIEGDGFILRMHRPRYLEAISDGTMVIVDTGHSRVIAASTTGRFLWEISDLPDSPIPRLYQPRWATLVNRDEVVISDHFHHRIVHLLRS